ncbi:alkyl hydroperoxide reductase, C22 subunit [Wigglesworthia glossinidia endosymbiont of Glossina morsitans morsitans (Yale colony)]|uniref:Thioredoxin peroxidase n=1 Tax=Wigglesworthia glossinidia endosymbiont of Glossina morsitans morsitans (Yale colony) TaxID=1142511 RepID=H6Q4Q0_WIGGL|nr:peroxiredoxin [Wigglesworthia glossinidia]AFA41110.1 alkyl hydroperoxide reductase, C22 subunit [Wigglesworthia glossinidia endosymbiont of Glossina morsitans morsitans (Yale colony)]
MLIAHKFHDFTAPAIFPNGKIIQDFNLSNYIKNKTAVLFFWPMNFTFVCPSELIAFNKRYNEFKNRNVNIIGVSIDTVYSHQTWQSIEIQKGGIGPVKYPMVSDIKRDIIQSYHVEHPHLGVALRASFLIDKDGIIRHQIVNDLPLGRDIDEIIRVIDALSFHETHGHVCPAQWRKNKSGMIPSKNGVSEYLSKHLNDL